MKPSIYRLLLIYFLFLHYVLSVTTTEGMGPNFSLPASTLLKVLKKKQKRMRRRREEKDRY